MRNTLRTALSDPALLRYLGVGVVDTFLGFGLVLFWQQVVGLSPVMSNVLGYAIGLVCSYVLNRRFTFRSVVPHRRALPGFALAAGISYGLNLVALQAALHLFSLPPTAAQVCGAVVFTGTFYVTSRRLAFKERLGPAPPRQPPGSGS